MLLEVVLILLVVMVLEVAEDVLDPFPPPLEPKHRLLENVTVVVGEDLTLSWLLPNWPRFAH